MNPFSNSILSHKTKILLMREMFGSIPSDDVIKWRSQFKHDNEFFLGCIVKEYGKINRKNITF